jgi:hypothetical protein
MLGRWNRYSPKSPTSMDLFLSGRIRIFDPLQLRREITIFDSRHAAERRRERREFNLTGSATCDPPGLLVRLDQRSRGKDGTTFCQKAPWWGSASATIITPATLLTERQSERFMPERSPAPFRRPRFIGKLVRTKPTASGRATRRASSDPACIPSRK